MAESFIEANGLKLCYEEFGHRDDPVILLIMGLGTQMISWPLPFCERLAHAGYRVIRYDNRDVGRSQRLEQAHEPNLVGLMVRARFGLSMRVPYRLDDMMMDATGLLDALDIPAAHVVGVSMGGMIAQLFAAHQPQRCLSLTSIMSTSGATHLPAASPRVRRQLTKTAPSDVDAYVEHALTTWHLIGSPEFAPPESELRSRIRVAFERSYYPAGFRRQLAAIVASGSREDLLPSIKVPTLVIHGKADQLVPVQGGIHTASLIPGAELELIDGMGHDLPPALLPRIADRIIGHVSRPRPSPPPAESQRTGAETDRTGA